MTARPPGPTAPAHLLASQKTLATMARLPPGDPVQPALQRALEDVVAHSGERSAVEVAEVYRLQYGLRHHDALRQAFPALCHWLGDGGFERLARDFTSLHPSEHPCLEIFTEKLGSFCQGYEGFAPGKAPAARSLSRFEAVIGQVSRGLVSPRLLHEAPHGQPSDARPVTESGRSDAAGLVPICIEGFEHAVHTYRDAVERTDGFVLPIPADRDVRLVIYRDDRFMVRSVEVSEAQSVLLSALRGGAAWSDALQAARAVEGTHTHDERVVRQWLGAWQRRGWLASST